MDGHIDAIARLEGIQELLADNQLANSTSPIC
jgi:hypothetical protein